MQGFHALLHIVIQWLAFEKLPLLFRFMIWQRAAALGELNVHTGLKATGAEEGSFHRCEAEVRTQFVPRLCDLR